MAEKDEQLSMLKDYGLSDYASRTYLALLRAGIADAKEVSRLSRVPLPKIYATLRQLEEKGLVENAAESPKRYVALPFPRFLEAQRGHHHERVALIERDIEAASRLFPPPARVYAPERGTVKVLHGKRAIGDKWRALVREAERDILVLAGDDLAARSPALRPFLDDFVLRGGTLRILARENAEDAAALRELASIAEVRSRTVIQLSIPAASLTLFDGRRAMVVHARTQDEVTTSFQDEALYTDSAATVALLRDMLEPLWRSAEPVDPK